jgi:hypothetical protein
MFEMMSPCFVVVYFWSLCRLEYKKEIISQRIFIILRPMAYICHWDAVFFIIYQNWSIITPEY